MPQHPSASALEGGPSSSEPSFSLLRYAFVLGVLTAVGPLGIDMYLPAFPAITRSMHVVQSQVQLSLVSYFIALALGQLFYGPIADRFGRRNPLIVGFTIFLVASVGAATATNIHALIFWRFIQGIGACAGMVIARSVARDLGKGSKVAQLYSLMVLVLGISPIVAPSLGASLIAIFPWTALFWFMSSFALICILTIVVGLPETLIRENRATRLSTAFAAYGTLLLDRRYLAVVMTGAFAQSGFFAYLAGSPFVLITLHGVSPTLYSLLFGLNAIALIGSSQLTAPLLRQFSADRIVATIMLIYLILAALLLTVMATGYDNLVVTIALLFLIIACLGTINPITSMQAVQEHPKAAGAASALMGSLQFGVGALASIALSALSNGTAMPLGIIILACATMAWASNRLLSRRQANMK